MVEIFNGFRPNVISIICRITLPNPEVGGGGGETTGSEGVGFFGCCITLALWRGFRPTPLRLLGHPKNE